MRGDRSDAGLALALDRTGHAMTEHLFLITVWINFQAG